MLERRTVKGKISLQEILDDEFIYFTKTSDGRIPSEYIWRYAGTAQIGIDGTDYSVYPSGSIGGQILIIFQKETDSVDVSYLKVSGNKLLVSLSCSL